MPKSSAIIFAMAPLYDVADTVFRQIIADCSPPDLFFTEFVNVDGLQSAGKKDAQKRLIFSAKEKPIIAQIWGLNPDNYFKTTKELIDMGFAGVDINMGCPDKAIVKNGSCSALINNRELAAQIISATKKAAKGKMPVSIKTRLGFNDIDYSWHEFLLNQGLDMLSIHGRTKKEMSKVPANWEAINNIRKLRDKISPDTLIIGNGEVLTKKQGIDLARKYKLDGIMIGTGIFNDPFVFADKSPWPNYSKQQKLDLFKKHVKLFDKTWKGTKPIKLLNKFCKIYINNFDGAKELREKLMAVKSADELLSMIG